MMTAAKKWLQYIVDGIGAVEDIEKDFANINSLLQIDPLVGPSFGYDVVADWLRSVYAATNVVRLNQVNPEGKAIRNKRNELGLVPFIGEIEAVWTTARLPEYDATYASGMPDIEIAEGLKITAIYHILSGKWDGVSYKAMKGDSGEAKSGHWFVKTLSGFLPGS